MASNNMDLVPRVLVNRVSEQAVIPSDLILLSAETITLRKYNYVNGRTEVPTDLTLTVPKGVLLQIGMRVIAIYLVCFVVPIPDILPRSIRITGNPFISGVEATVSVEMHNRSGSDFEVKAGDQIARLDILGNIKTLEFVDITPDRLD